MGQRTALITGATSGIGEATARLLAEHKYNLIICGRRRDRLAELEKELSAHTKVTSLSFDVRDNDAVKASLATLTGEWKNIDVLINNAGNAHGLAPIHQGSVDDWDAMMDINVKGLLYVSREVIPGMTDISLISDPLQGRRYIRMAMCIAPVSLLWMRSPKVCVLT
jgi:3-hydroxy acid dehydrogenase/malonic semialdehyde reductase